MLTSVVTKDEVKEGSFACQFMQQFINIFVLAVFTSLKETMSKIVQNAVFSIKRLISKEAEDEEHKMEERERGGGGREREREGGKEQSEQENCFKICY